MLKNIHIYMYINIYTHTCIHTYTHVCVYTYMYIYIGNCILSPNRATKAVRIWGNEILDREEVDRLEVQRHGPNIQCHFSLESIFNSQAAIQRLRGWTTLQSYRSWGTKLDLRYVKKKGLKQTFWTFRWDSEELYLS